MSRNYHYTSAPSSRHGLMVCTVCRQKITHGEYRVHEKRDAYVTQHRVCTADDPRWAQLHAERAAHAAAFEAREKALTDACRAFYQQWGVTDLAEYLPELSHDD